MAYKYQTNFTINSTDGSEKIELRNPAQSGKKLELLKIGVVSDAGFEVFGLRRYDELATHDSPTQVEVYKWDPSGDAPVGEVYWGAASTISFQGSIDFVHDEQLDSGDGGDDAEIKAAVEMVFKVEVEAVTVANVKGKEKRAGRVMGRRKDWKKAYVSLKPGQEINFAAGE